MAKNAHKVVVEGEVSALATEINPHAEPPTHVECSNCEENLTVAARRNGTTVERMRFCPKCGSKFEPKEEKKCYACSTVLAGEHCLNCGAPAEADEDFMHLVAWVRKHEHRDGRDARAHAQALLGMPGDLNQEMVQEYIEAAQEQGLLKYYTTQATGSGSSLGDLLS